MRVLISGAGIAGMTLAYWLHHYGLQPVVIEQAGTLRRDGYAIDFLGTSYDVAERMGVIERLAAEQIPFDALIYVNKADKPIARLDAALMRDISGGKYLALMHSTLEETLYEKLAGQVEVRFGRSLSAVEPGATEVAVTFDDGTHECFDLLVGADGVHSNTRTLVFGPAERFVRYLGYTIASYPLADRYGIGATYKLYNEPGRQVMAYSTSQPGQIFVFFMYQSARQEHLPRNRRLPRLREEFNGMGWLAEEFLADVAPDTNIFMDSVLQVQMPAWYQGRVALVGDACDCPTLLSGQGAALAMGGAYLLAAALHETGDYRTAFARYQQQMYAYVSKQQKSARDFAKTFLPGNAFNLFIQRWMMKLLLRPAFRSLLRHQMGADSLLSPQHASS